MSLPRLARTGTVAGVVTLAIWTCAAGTAAASPVRAPATETGRLQGPTSAARLAADPSPTGPTPGPSLPSEADVARAQAAAAAAAQEVADITAEVERAATRLETLQREMADAVAADERAQQQLVDAEVAVTRASAGVAAAGRARDDADRVLAATAALMYMQGGDLQNQTTLLFSPPGVMSDLAVVLDQNAHRVRENLDAATAAAADAAWQERMLASARDDRATAVREAGVKRSAAEVEATRAGAEAARLGQRQEELTVRLAELQQGAADLIELREAAARLGSGDLLGVQGAGPLDSGPRAAQQLALSMMASHGWDEVEYRCLVDLWQGESGWSWSALNASSGAYGIPQSLPGWKMASAGSDWLTNPATQIAWGMDYIASVYGSPCRAHDRWLARSPHWY